MYWLKNSGVPFRVVMWSVLATTVLVAMPSVAQVAILSVQPIQQREKDSPMALQITVRNITSQPI